MLVGNHEAMNMTGDLRYVHPGEYAAFADRDSKARRDRVYEANREAIEAAYRARDPNMTPEAIRDAWMKATPLGMLEHQAAWRPDGEIGKWVIGNPAVVKLGDTLFVHGGISAAYAALLDRGDQPAGRRRAQGAGRKPDRDHQRSARAALVSRADQPRRAMRPTTRAPSRRDKRPRSPSTRKSTWCCRHLE